MGYANPWTYWQSDPSQSILSVFKKLQSSQESLGPGHGGLGLCSWEETHIRDPRRKLQVGGGGGRKKKKKTEKSAVSGTPFSLKPALPRLYAYAKSTTESKREREREREGGKGRVGTGER